MLPRRMKIIAAFVLVSIVAMNGFALEVPYRYHASRVEAALLFNVAKFVTWPDDSFDDHRSPLVFAVFDAERYKVAREALAGRKVGGREVIIRKIAEVAEARNAHLLFIDAGEAHRLDRLLVSVAGSPVLTISNIEGFVERGGMVELFTSERKIRFGVQLAVLRESGLTISAEVLRLASFVRGADGGEAR